MNKAEILYEYLLSRGDKWTAQADVAIDLYNIFGNATAYFAPDRYHDTDGRRRLSKVISEINASPVFEKIIISGNKGIKIANEKEHARYLEAQYNAAIRKLSRVYKMSKKAKLHHQLDFCGHTIEAFLEKDENPS